MIVPYRPPSTQHASSSPPEDAPATALRRLVRSAGGPAVAVLTVLTAAGVVQLFRDDPLDTDRRVRMVLLALALSTAAYGLFVACSPASRRSIRAAGSAIVAYSIVTLFLLGELRCVLLDRSHSVGYTLAGRRWNLRHCQYNSYGQRSPEPDKTVLEKKRRILVVGDSLAAGAGVEVEQRFSDLLQPSLPEDWAVLNVAMSGTDSRRQLEDLVEFPWKPDLLVLSYFGNDILEAASELGHAPPRFTPYSDLRPTLRWLVERSSFVNHLYWSRPREDLAGWWTMLRTAWADSWVLALHERDLQAFVDHARANGCPLIVVLFPFLHDLEFSRTVYVPWVKRVFERHSVPVIDVLELVKDMPLSERIANPNDVHPSPRVHAAVAEELGKVVQPFLVPRR